MNEEKLKSIFVKACVATAVLLLVSLVFAAIPIFFLAKIQPGIMLVQKFIGVIVTLFGVGCIAACLSPTLPPITFARALIVFLLGLAVFSLSPLFAVAGAIVFAADRLAPPLQLSTKQED